MDDGLHTTEELRASRDPAWPRGPLHAPLRLQVLAELTELTAEVERLEQLIAGESSEPAPTSLSLSRDTGWLLGVLAAACGNDLLLARREPRGLQLLVERVRAILDERGWALLQPLQPLAAVEPEPNDWELPWAAANALFLAGSEECSAECEWSFVRRGAAHVLCGYSEPGPKLTRFAAELTHALPGARFETVNREWTLTLLPRPTP